MLMPVLMLMSLVKASLRIQYLFTASDAVKVLDSVVVTKEVAVPSGADIKKRRNEAYTLLTLIDYSE